MGGGEVKESRGRGGEGLERQREKGRERKGETDRHRDKGRERE